MTRHSTGLQERFDHYTIPEPNSGCLLWLGSVTSSGYGQLRFKKRLRTASHIALELAGRPVPAGQCACHRCDNPSCVNADHLFIGTQGDNILDMHRKQRENISGLDLGRQQTTHPAIKARAKMLYEAGRGPTYIARTIGMSATGVHSWMKEWGHKAVPQKDRSHCPSGHPLSGGNLYLAPRGDRICRECKRASDRKRREIRCAH